LIIERRQGIAMRDELLEVLSLAHAEIRRFAELPRCFPINRQVLPRLAELIDRLQGKRRRKATEPVTETAEGQTEAAAPPLLPLLPPVQSRRVAPRESWMLPPRPKLQAPRRCKASSSVKERRAVIAAVIAQHGPLTMSQISIRSGIRMTQLQYLLERGPFSRSHYGKGAKWSNRADAAPQSTASTDKVEVA
jgi:hypothetical protein